MLFFPYDSAWIKNSQQILLDSHIIKTAAFLYTGHSIRQTWDLTPYLEKNNTLTVTVGNGWYKGILGFYNQGCHYGSRTALLFAKILRSYSDQAVLTGVDSRQGAGNNKLRILSFINDHYRTVTLKDVASHFNYSVPHCSKLIRDETGIGFVAFVRRIKMNHAAALLLNTRTSVADIANMVGYENPESFIRVFQKVYQMSPTAYRKKVNGE